MTFCCVLLTHTVPAVGNVMGGTNTSSGLGPMGVALATTARTKGMSVENAVVNFMLASLTSELEEGEDSEKFLPTH